MSTKEPSTALLLLSLYPQRTEPTFADGCRDVLVLGVERLGASEVKERSLLLVLIPRSFESVLQLLHSKTVAFSSLDKGQSGREPL